jgi:hypothetical protein
MLSKNNGAATSRAELLNLTDYRTCINPLEVDSPVPPCSAFVVHVRVNMPSEAVPVPGRSITYTATGTRTFTCTGFMSEIDGLVVVGGATCERLSDAGGWPEGWPVLRLTRVLQKGGDPAAGSPTATLLRLRPSHRARLRPLPPLRVRRRTSGAPDFHGVTGGVYKARERIHRGVADPRLLAIPASRGRVADHDPNLDRVYGIRSALRPCSPLSLPL